MSRMPAHSTLGCTIKTSRYIATCKLTLRIVPLVHRSSLSRGSGPIIIVMLCLVGPNSPHRIESSWEFIFLEFLTRRSQLHKEIDCRACVGGNSVDSQLSRRTVFDFALLQHQVHYRYLVISPSWWDAQLSPSIRRAAGKLKFSTTTFL
jgi:hypothetical protein